MTRITKEQALATLEEIVAENPDYIYERPVEEKCLYSVDGAPSCIVGHVIHRLSPDLFQKLVEYEALAGESFSIAAVSATRAGEDFEYYGGYRDQRVSVVKALADALDPEADQLLADVQAEQDNGVSWGASLLVAKGVDK